MSIPADLQSPGTAFDTMAGLVKAHGWGSVPTLARARSAFCTNSRPLEANASTKAVLRALIEYQVITGAQANDLDQLIKQQLNFPAYRLMRELGAGGMGTVYLVTHLQTNRVLALKTIIGRLQMDADFVGRFNRESKVLIGLHHTNIAEIFESGESNGVCYMAMEFINGPSLAALLREHKVFPELYVLKLCRQVADGLAYVYEKSELVHRDIKPENILIERSPTARSNDHFPSDDVAKLIDFGLVKPVDDNERLTQTGMTIGTPLYMSPEQIRGEKIDCRSDIYGLAATMYHLLTGVTPFSGSSPGAIMSAHLTQGIPDPATRVPSLQSTTRNVVMMGMAKDVNERYLTFAGLRKALDEAIDILDDKHGQAPRLLRKPLVLKSPVRKSVEKSGQAADPAQSSLPPASVASREFISERIVRKFRENQESAKPPAPQASPLLPVMTTPEEVPDDISAPGEASRTRMGETSNNQAASPPRTAEGALRSATTAILRGRRASAAGTPGTASSASHASPAPTASGEIDTRIAASIALKQSSGSAIAGNALGNAASGNALPVGRNLKSSVFDEDPERKIGTGMVPWIVFAVALAILVLWLCLH